MFDLEIFKFTLFIVQIHRPNYSAACAGLEDVGRVFDEDPQSDAGAKPDCLVIDQVSDCSRRTALFSDHL
jgi:hypothetical protein